MYTTALLATLPTILVSGIALWYHYYYSRSRRKEEPHPQASPRTRPPTGSKVLFFPDDVTARSLSSKQPSESPVEQGSLSVLIETLQEARRSLDVCVFAFSCKELADVLINAHRGGVAVRVVSDNEQMAVSGSQIERLRRTGIQVRNDHTSYFMHHKFAVADEAVLITGSLNWTLQGVCGNQENVIVTSTPELVTPFSMHFEKLWEMYDPEKIEYYVEN